MTAYAAEQAPLLSAGIPEAAVPVSNVQHSERQCNCNCCAVPRAQQTTGPTFPQKLERAVSKISVPINQRTTKMGCESFVPMPLEQECFKAARILERLSIYPNTSPSTAGASLNHPITIPPSTLSAAVALAIFTTGRLGCGRISASTGSGILIARRSDGSWGQPAAIAAHALGLGFLAFGAEVSERVYVITCQVVLDRIMAGKRFHMGPEASLAAGPYGGGAGVVFSGLFGKGRDRETEAMTVDEEKLEQFQSEKDFEIVAEEKGRFAQIEEKADASVHRLERAPPLERRRGGRRLSRALKQPVFCYMRSQGLYAGFQGEGSILVERPDANEVFYGKHSTLRQVLGGEISADVRNKAAMQALLEALRQAEFGQEEPRSS